CQLHSKWPQLTF
nr:immunoglobulin light chain junction region [Macaca mulatta]